MPLFLIFFIVILLFLLPVKFIIFLYRHAFSRETAFHLGLDTIIHVAIIALIAAGFQWLIAKKWGVQIILNRLSAKKPDLSDRYHILFKNIVSEMQIAGGLPNVEAYVIPTWTQNSFALISKKSKPIIAVSEGMISNLNREELQGVVAHELAHVMRGDSFFIGLVAAMTNFFYWIGDQLKPVETDRTIVKKSEASPIFFLYYIMIRTASTLMRLFSCFLSRERELLADATAVEMTRNPFALANALYKARLGVSDLGSDVDGYTPIFILPPKIKGIDSKEGFWANLFSTHPPIGKRLFNLLTMARRSFSELEAERKNSSKMYEPRKWVASTAGKKRNNSRWFVMNDYGQWKGPYSIPQIKDVSWFNLSCSVRLVEGDPGIQEIPETVLRKGVRARYLRLFLENFSKREGKKDFEKDNLTCPSCGEVLDTEYYEGVRIRPCVKCGGKLVHEETLVRILSRTELSFSEEFNNKIKLWRDKWIHTSLWGKRFSSEYWCPVCGISMVRGFYSTYYYLVVDRCFRCEVIWFDCHELEALQVLVEDAVKNPPSRNCQK